MNQPATDGRSFLKQLVESNLLNSHEHATIAARLDSGEIQPSPRAVANELIRRRTLTRWQAEQSLAGMRKFDLGRFRLLELVGRGAYGVVFRARDPIHDRIVAIKVLSPTLTENAEAVARFEREIRTTITLQHKNVVTAFESGTMENRHYLVMEFVQGVDLERWMEDNGSPPVPVVCEIGRQVANGLQAAFELGVIHRDIKPLNLIIHWGGPSGPVLIKILDLGLARLVAEQAGLTQHGQILGTVDFLSPEQVESRKDLDIRSDIYSLGCTLYRMLTNKSPFDGASPMMKAIARLTKDPAPAFAYNEEVLPALQSVLSKMMARDPMQRYQSPREVAEALTPFTWSYGAKDAFETSIVTASGDSGRVLADYFAKLKPQAS